MIYINLLKIGGRSSTKTAWCGPPSRYGSSPDSLERRVNFPHRGMRLSTDDTGKVIGTPSVLLVGSKEEAKQQAKTLARSLGLKVYGIVDKTGTGGDPHPWLVTGVGKSL